MTTKMFYSVESVGTGTELANSTKDKEVPVAVDSYKLQIGIFKENLSY